MPRAEHRRVAICSVVLLGLLALLQYWLTNRRPLQPGVTAVHEFGVTSSRDKGPGSLREAIFAADIAPQRARIILRLSPIALQSPLPPLVNPRGIEIEGAEPGAEIDARDLGTGAVFDVDAPNSVIDGIKITNAPEQAVLVRADFFRLLNAKIVSCDEGLDAVEGIGNLIVDKTSFENNRVGITLASGGPGIIVRNNHFVGHKDAAIWAVRGSPFRVGQTRGFLLKSNYFESDRISVVAGNVPLVAEENEFVKSHEAALFVMGENAVIRGNRIRNGAGIGVVAQGTEGIVIEDNELDHNQTIALLVRSSRSALVNNNRVYDNGYGIAFVLGKRESPSFAAENSVLRQRYDGIVVIGDSPVLRRNRALNNSSSGVSVLDFIPLTGGAIAANPFLENNILQGNKLNGTFRGEYRVREAERKQ